MRYLTTAQVADELGVTIRRVQALIQAGRLPAERFGQVWMVEARHLAKVKNRPPGRPKGIKPRPTQRPK